MESNRDCRELPRKRKKEGLFEKSKQGKVKGKKKRKRKKKNNMDKKMSRTVVHGIACPGVTKG